MNFFTRLSNGWKLTVTSFRVLRENKQLILFPILSGVALILIMASFVLPILGMAGWDIDAIGEPDTLTTYLLVFLYYVVNYFVVVFFNMALIHCTRLYFRGEEPTIAKGLQFSKSRIGAIFAWAVVAATVGTILKLIQENAGWLGKIIVGLIGMVWGIATFFVVPVIAYENVGPFDAIKRSSKIIGEKWGESLAANFSFGIIQFLAMLLVALPLFFIGAMIHVGIGVVLAMLGAFLIMAIMSAAQTIFISAVYHNVTNDPVKHFDQQLLDNLFEQK